MRASKTDGRQQVRDRLPCARVVIENNDMGTAGEHPGSMGNPAGL
jgi:hypothetical protein